MFTARSRKGLASAALGAVTLLALAGCASSDPLSSGESAGTGGSDEPIVVGSQDYYSNEIIAEIYAQALENAGFEVERSFSIGQRDAYIPLLESGEVSVFPEYTGNLLEFFDAETEARTPEDVYDALGEALPENLTVLDQSDATDQDTYSVTTAFAEQYSLTSIADLANVDEPLTIGAAPEFEQRPYGPAEALEVYGVEIGFTATATALEALQQGQVNIADIYTSDPAFGTGDIVALEDPEAIILSSNVVPLVNADLSEDAITVLNEVSAALTAEGLVALNTQSTVDQESSEAIATQWLEENDLL